MRQKKLWIYMISFVVIGTLTTGCFNTKITKDLKSNKITNTKEKSKLKAKCSATECIKKIEIENTVEEVNKIIGVDGKSKDENNNTYEYDLGNDEKITIKLGSDQKLTITADFDKEDIANKKVDLSNATDLKAKVSAGITYDQFKAEIGNVDGVLTEKSSSSNKYMWVSTKGGYLRGTFRTRDNMCSFFTGFADKK